MPQFTIDEDLAAMVERLAKPKPFENLTFNNALRRVLAQYVKVQGPAPAPDARLEELIARAQQGANRVPKKARTPDPITWVQTVPELRSRRELNNWAAICKHLKINTSGDSARRKLASWVQSHRPSWPAVPQVDGV